VSWLLALGGAWACDEPTTTPQLAAALVRSDDAFVAADLPAFEQATTEARSTVACVEEVVPVKLVAQLHRTEGLAAFFEQDVDRAGQAFAAARRLDPLYRFPSQVVPPGNPLLDVFVAVDLADGPSSSVPDPAEGSIRVDGRRANTRPDALPTLFQRLGGEGRVVDSRYLWPGDPLPPYPVAQAVVDTPPPVATKASVRTPLRWGAGAAALTSGLLYGAAGLVHLQYEQADDTDQLDTLRGTNNALVASSGISLALGAGLLGASFVVP